MLLDELGQGFKSLYYEDFHQFVGSSKTGGHVTVHKLSTEHKDINEVNYKIIKETILQLKANGRSYSEINILCRTNKKLKAISYLLAKDGFPILSSEGLALEIDSTCNFLVNFLQLSQLPNDLKSAVSCAEYLFESDAELLKQMGESPSPLYYLRQRIKSELNIDLPSLSRFNLYEALEELAQAFSINKNDAFAQRLLELALDKQKDGLQEFLSWWEENKGRTYISSPENIDAIQLMTVHKSKGLEFPIVIYPFADYSTSRSHMDQKWVEADKVTPEFEVGLVNMSSRIENTVFQEAYLTHQKDTLLDDLNSTYVALTRAIEEMYIIAQPPSSVKEHQSLKTFFYPLLKDVDPNGSYELGTPLLRTNKALNYSSTNTSKALHMHGQWHDKVKLSFTAQRNWDVPKDSDSPYPQSRSSRDKGNMLHSVLAEIESIPNWENTIKELFTSGKINLEERTEAINILNPLFKNEHFKALWKKGKHYVERDLILKSGATFRPDRLIISRDHVTLIDFKSGVKDIAHHKQILHYKKLLQTLFKQNVQAFLVYLNPVEVEAVL